MQSNWQIFKNTQSIIRKRSLGFDWFIPIWFSCMILIVIMWYACDQVRITVLVCLIIAYHWVLKWWLIISSSTTGSWWFFSFKLQNMDLKARVCRFDLEVGLLWKNIEIGYGKIFGENPNHIRNRMVASLVPLLRVFKAVTVLIRL